MLVEEFCRLFNDYHGFESYLGFALIVGAVLKTAPSVFSGEMSLSVFIELAYRTVPANVVFNVIK